MLQLLYFKLGVWLFVNSLWQGQSPAINKWPGVPRDVFVVQSNQIFKCITINSSESRIECDHELLKLNLFAAATRRAITAGATAASIIYNKRPKFSKNAHAPLSQLALQTRLVED